MQAPAGFIRFVNPSPADRRRLIVAAVALFALVTVLRFAIANPNIPLVTPWFIPVVLAALAYGFRGAAVATFAALVPYTVWSITDGPSGLGFWELFSRAVALAIPWLIFGWVFELLAGTLSARTQFTEQLEQANAELERSNRDLEQFANVASHDLREPLRVVDGFVDLLDRRAGPELSPDHRRYLGMMKGATSRMQELIDDILAWSRAGSAQLEITRVDSGELVRDVEASLAPAIAEAGATIEADGLPTIRADRAQLRQVFQNLMANAIKFHGDDPPRVVVTGEETTDGWRFSIADNGIGVDPKYAERIFEMFSRLHGRDAYPGTGVGLAICATVVEKHGGRIWVEPTPGGGSTFRFTVRGSMPG